jgi:hypothetical protein
MMKDEMKPSIASMIGARRSCAVQAPFDFPAPSTVRDWKLAGGRAPGVVRPREHSTTAHRHRPGARKSSFSVIPAPPRLVRRPEPQRQAPPILPGI